MTSTPDNLKQEPSGDDHEMYSDNDGGLEPQNNSGLSDQTDYSQLGQRDTNQATQSNENQPGQGDANEVDRNNGEQPGQTNVNQAIQNNGTRAGQKDINQSDWITGNRSSDENPFQLAPSKRKVTTENTGNGARAFSPAVEDPSTKKAKTDHAFIFNPPPDAKTAPASQQPQKPSRASPLPEDDGVGDPDLERDLVGSQVCPENMTTLGLVKKGNRPSYLNQYEIDGRSILRIESLKDEKFDENAEGVLRLTSDTYQAQNADKKWRHVNYVLGVAAFGSESNFEEFLCKLDPENPVRFKWAQTILIGIRWEDRTITFVNRQWWRNNYVARDLSAKQTFLDRKKDGYYYWYKTCDDPQWRKRVNKKAFEDYRLFKWAFLYEKRYYQAMNPGKKFEIRDREKSPSPIVEELAKFREMTVERSPSSKIHESVELPDDDEGFDSDSRYSTQSRYKSSGRSKAHRDASPWVEPTGSPRPRNNHRFSTMRRSQKPLGTTPRPIAMAH